MPKKSLASTQQNMKKVTHEFEAQIIGSFPNSTDPFLDLPVIGNNALAFKTEDLMKHYFVKTNFNSGSQLAIAIEDGHHVDDSAHQARLLEEAEYSPTRHERHPLLNVDLIVKRLFA